MTEVIYASAEHQAVIDKYVDVCKAFARDSGSKTKYKSYLDVLDIIFEYHNNYGKGARENNWYDWLMIIPINVSVATNGFFAGVETNRNRAVIRGYKVVLNELVQEVVSQVDGLKQTRE